MTKKTNVTKPSAQDTKKPVVLSTKELEGASGGAACNKDPYLSIQKKRDMAQAGHEVKPTGRVK